MKSQVFKWRFFRWREKEERGERSSAARGREGDEMMVRRGEGCLDLSFWISGMGSWDFDVGWGIFGVFIYW